MTIIAPAAGDTVLTGTVIRAVITDESRVVAADFYAGNRHLGRDSTGQSDTFELVWNTVRFEPGRSETLLCAARDAADNVGRSAPIVVVVGPDAGFRHGGTVATPETWLAADNPHVVDRDLFVESFLRLEPGVRVLVAPGVAIRVGSNAPAGLIAIGKQDSLITLTSLGNSAPWAGIFFRRRAVADSCRLQRCRLERGSAALISTESCAITLTDCRLGSSGRAVVLTGCGFSRCEGNTFEDCAEIPVRVDAPWAATIGTGNTFRNNSRNGVEVPGGTLSQSATWPNPGVPWCITADLTIAGPANPLLVVSEGCSMLFADSAGLFVADDVRPGGLRCDGSVSTIVFSSLNPTGRWRGIEFRQRTDTLRSLFRFTTIERSGRAGITCYRAPISLSGSRIAYCAGNGITLRNCGFRQFNGNTIEYCTGYGLELSASALTTLGSDNTYKDNRPGIAVLADTIAAGIHQWRNQRTPYVISGVVDVGGDSPQLVVDPGADLRFAPGAGLAVGRTGSALLRAVGTTSTITFTGTDTVSGHWRGLAFHPSTQPGTILDRCRVLYGGGGGAGIVYVDSCVPRIVNNEIGWSSNWCIYLNNTTLDPESLRLQNNLHDWHPAFDDIYDAGR